MPTITTPSGYVVSICDYVPYGLRRQLQKMMIGNNDLDVDTAKAPNNLGTVKIKASALFDAQDESLKTMVLSVRVGETTKTDPSDILSTVMSWPSADGECVMQAVNSITQKERVPNSKG